MQAGGRGTARPPIGIAFEGDLGQRIDAVLAVALLSGLTGKGEARSVALCISRPNLRTAQLADVVSSFYNPRPGGAIVGVPEGTASAGDVPLAAPLAKKTAEGTPVYNPTITRLLDTPDNAVLIRNVLLAQNDGNAGIVVAGPLTGLARLLALYGSRPQIATKARHLVIAAGSFAAGPPDPAIKADLASARKVFADWPTPVIAVGLEVGEALPYPAASIEKDFAWSPAHPVVDAYRAFKPMPYDAPASALAAVLHAVHADKGYFTLSEPGTITVLDDGATRFTPGADGRHRYLIVDPAQKAAVVSLYTALVSAPPPPRPGRGRGGATPDDETPAS